MTSNAGPEPPPPPSPLSTPLPKQPHSSENVNQATRDSTISALRSARYLPEKLQDFLPRMRSQYTVYEDAIVKKVKDELKSACEHPTVACGVVVAAGFLFMRGPRRFLYRHTLGRLQNEERLFVKAEQHLQQLNKSVAILDNDSKKLLKMAAFDEEIIQRGQTKIKSAGKQIQDLVKSIYQFETEATDLMDELRQIPGRDALKLRAEVASMTSSLKDTRSGLNKTIVEISELGIHV